MQDFDLTVLANLYFSGYRFVIVINRGDHEVLKPLQKEAPTELVQAMNCYQCSLLSRQIVALARGEYPAFLPPDFFEPNYADYVLSR